MEWRTQQARPFYRQREESSPACVVCVCGMRAACGGPGGLPLALPHISMLLPYGAPVALLCSNATGATIANPPNSAQLGGIPYHSPKAQVTSKSVQ